MTSRTCSTPGCGSLGSRARSGVDLLGSPAPADAGLHEVVEVAVEDGAGVAGLVAGPQVLDDLVGVEDVVAHLVAPARGDVALEVLLERGFLFLLLGQELG